MSDFCSDFLTWMTAAAIGGAAVLGNIDLPPATAKASETSVVALNSADPALIARSEQAAPQAPVIKQAKLTLVDFSKPEPRRQTEASLPVGRVTGNSVNLRAGPGTNFGVVGSGSRDETLVVTGKRDGVWVQVMLPFAQTEAWIHGDYFTATN